MAVLSAVWKYIVVFVLAGIPWAEVALVIPLAILYGMNPLLVGSVALAGNLATVYLVIIYFEKFQEWRKRRKKGNSRPSRRHDRAVKLWRKYGLPGLTLSGPLLIGSHIAAVAAMALGASKQDVFFWSTISLVLWTVLITAAAAYGIEWLGWV
ncbi:small multi-drug export protein [Virgibacillus sediminis]|uniref:Small multi-drug export protein n=1 Tax=Virgibacillus sediminis TaxID=202260 RepID=A0ABV7A9I9_9BACI